MRGRDYVHFAIFLFIKKKLYSLCSVKIQTVEIGTQRNPRTQVPVPRPGVVHTDHSRNALCTGGGSSVSLIRNDAGRVYGELGTCKQSGGGGGWPRACRTHCFEAHSPGCGTSVFNQHLTLSNRKSLPGVRTVEEGHSLHVRNTIKYLSESLQHSPSSSLNSSRSLQSNPLERGNPSTIITRRLPQKWFTSSEGSRLFNPQTPNLNHSQT